jgi:hypothetical protein
MGDSWDGRAEGRDGAGGCWLDRRLAGMSLGRGCSVQEHACARGGSAKVYRRVYAVGIWELALSTTVVLAEAIAPAGRAPFPAGRSLLPGCVLAPAPTTAHRTTGPAAHGAGHALGIVPMEASLAAHHEVPATQTCSLPIAASIIAVRRPLVLQDDDPLCCVSLASRGGRSGLDRLNTTVMVCAHLQGPSSLECRQTCECPAECTSGMRHPPPTAPRCLEHAVLALCSRSLESQRLSATWPATRGAPPSFQTFSCSSARPALHPTR